MAATALFVGSDRATLGWIAVGAKFGFDGAFWFQSALMVLGVGFLRILHAPAHVHRGPKRSVRTETAEALQHVWRDPHTYGSMSATPNFADLPERSGLLFARLSEKQTGIGG